jgi:hypothetical protein
MKTLKERLALPLPKTMRTLERDHRGYPIPFIVMRDKDGKAHFTINDIRQVAQCVNKRLCAICGKRITGGFWFVGGSRCFLHEDGAFLDPPLHLECAEYALVVCPFLAARQWRERIDDRLLDKDKLPDGMMTIKNEYMPPSLPERFGLGRALSYHAYKF